MCILLMASSLEKPRQDAVGNRGRPKPSGQHLFEKADADIDIARLHAAVHQSVVYKLVAAKSPGLNVPEDLHGLVQLPRMAISLQQRRESDEVGPHRTTRGQHLLQQPLSRMQVATFHTSVEDRVVRDSVVGHILCGHLAEQLDRVGEVLVETVALDQSCVQNRVLVLAGLLHVREDLKGLGQIPALDACIDHAAVCDSVGVAPLLVHVVPCLQHLLQVAGLAVCLDQNAQRHRRGLHAELPHALDGRLKTREVLQAAASVEECIEENLVDILRLSFDETLDQADAAVNPRPAQLGATVADGLHEHAGHSILVCGRAAALQVLQRVPSLIHALAPHDILQKVRRRAAGAARRALTGATLTGAALPGATALPGTAATAGGRGDGRERPLMLP
mmetsp:Transcript_36061/g.103734  ORF Transcript_36061/g.103734 Transcript_36061/m.103734 type:complete len:391 (+) Transcript_36061:1244-2416(+)